MPRLRVHRCLAALAVLAVSAIATSDLQAQGVRPRSGSVTSTSTRTRGGGTADPNIRRDEAANPVGKPASPEPPGKIARGATPVEPGYVCVDSRVDLLVRIYIDGAFAGSVAPWGDSCGFYGAGDHKLYARAVFTDGSMSMWGPVNVDATPGFRWTLRP